MAIKPRKSTKNPPIFSHEFVILNHADIAAFIALIFVFGFMIQATSNIASMFVAVQYNTTSVPDPTLGGDTVISYSYGVKDLCGVFFYLLVCIIVHAMIKEYILDKISKKLHLSKVKHSKFNESGQLVFFYIMSVLWGVDVIFKQKLLFNISSLWEGYPHSQMTFMFKFYFIIQLSYWLHCYPELYLQKIKREEMPARIQYATVSLIYVAAAYFLNYNRVGVCLLVLHYVSEALFHVARLVDFFDKEEKGGSKVCYMAFNIVFVFVRLASIILSVLTFWYGLALSENQGLSIPEGNFNIQPIRITALLAVCLLQVYLMFHFITDILRQMSEKTPQIQSKKSALKKPAFGKKKKDESRKGYDDNELTEVDQNTKRDLKNKLKSK